MIEEEELRIEWQEILEKKFLALSVLDICPTLDMYEKTDEKFAKSYFHWFF